MLEDIIGPAKQTLLERLTSPLLSSFVIAWSLWNWKFYVILASQASVTSTFKLIESNVFPDATAIAMRGLLLPLVSTLAYIFLYPYPAHFVNGFVLRRQREMLAQKKTIDDQTQLTVEESRKVRAEAFESELRHREQVATLTEEIARLTASLDATKRNDSQSAPTPFVKVPDFALPDTQMHLMKLIESMGGAAKPQVVIEKSKRTRIETEFDIQELMDKGLLMKEYNGGLRSMALQFTHEGRRVLLNSSEASGLSPTEA